MELTKSNTKFSWPNHTKFR